MMPRQSSIPPIARHLVTGVNSFALALHEDPSSYFTPVIDPSFLVMFPRNLLYQAAPTFVVLAWLDVLIGVRATAINTTIDDADSRIQYSDQWNASGDCNK